MVKVGVLGLVSLVLCVVGLWDWFGLGFNCVVLIWFYRFVVCI